MIMIWSLAGAVLGAIIGSFLATAAIRWPAGRSASRGRSACDACGRRLNAVDLIPLFGFLLRRGRCATCDAPIDRRHPLIELAAAAIGGIALGVAGPAGIAGAIFGWALLLLAILDVEHFWLPDRLTWPLALAGLAAGSIGLPPWPYERTVGLAAGFLGLFLIGRLYWLLRGREGLGGGDPKLLGAIGAWLGWAPLPFVLLLAAATGLAAALALRLRGGRVTGSTRLPFGALLAVAAWPMWLVLFGR